MPTPSSFSSEEMSSRLVRIRAEMVAHDLHALITSNQANIRYATGFRGEPHTLLLTADEAVLYTSFRTLPWAQQQTEALESHIEISIATPPLKQIAEKLTGSAKHIGIDHSTSHTSFLFLEQQFATHTLKPCSIIEHTRRCKSPAEIDLLRKSQQINEAIFNATLPQIRPGMTERTVQGIILTEIATREEVDSYSFTPIVAAGANAWEIHHLPDHTEILASDMLLLDLGVIYQGYASDMTRTICMGHATEMMREVYDTVGQAQAAAITAMLPGASTHEIDSAAREVITKAGFGTGFTHGLGHSIGLETHDPGLNLSPSTPDEILAPGMAFTVEPGTYLENTFGVRTEDIVIITEDGHENITQQSHALLELHF